MVGLQCWVSFRCTAEIQLNMGMVVPDFAAPWTVAHQAPSSMGFPGQEYWSGFIFFLLKTFFFPIKCSVNFFFATLHSMRDPSSLTRD